MRSLLIRIRNRLIAPVLGRLDAIEQSVGSRLDTLDARLAAVESVIEMIDARASSVAERSVAQSESYARVARRLDEIEKLLADPPGDGDA